jgi:hypothetical protein
MKKTRLSLLYLGSYLTLIGLGLLAAPGETLRLLQSKGDYGDVFPRVAGMLMSGLGVAVFGLVRARADALYPATLLIRIYFLVCISFFYWRTTDPFFLVLLVIVVIGFVLTSAAFLFERKRSG